MKIGFIGVGNMGGAIVNGYLAAGKASAADISLFEPDAEKTTRLEKAGCYICKDIGELVRRSDMIVIGVKPNMFEQVLPEIAEAYASGKILISIAAGISISLIGGFVGESAKIIRTMPNTPAMVLEGMTAICRNDRITNEDMEKARMIFESVGKVYEIPEELIHCSIGVSGSSPAYTYMYIDALAQGAAENGMDKGQALICAAQSVLGAAKMVLETGIDPVQLRINVCSPGGTTIEAVQKLQENKFEEIVKAGAQAAVNKSKRMTK
ncbi:MAG: pyrroline-5-carboxylate reductase [Oscillospiraceae bacterium]|nr:pyrroline-5-carboxylate reductase [Oscillospiraceae bacterium]